MAVIVPRAIYLVYNQNCAISAGAPSKPFRRTHWILRVRIPGVISCAGCGDRRSIVDHHIGKQPKNQLGRCKSSGTTQTIAPRTSARRILARQRQLNCGPTLRACGCDDYAACDDEWSDCEDCGRWKLLECQTETVMSDE